MVDGRRGSTRGCARGVRAVGRSGAQPARVGVARASARRGLPCGRAAVLHDGFPEPPALYSHDGALDVRLRAAVGAARMGRTRVSAWSYNGSVPGPTLVICAGDHVTVHLENDLPEPTNLHTHGFHVSPEGNSDNIFVRVEPHQQFTYEYASRGHVAGLLLVPPARPHAASRTRSSAAWPGRSSRRGAWTRLPALRRVPQRWIVLDNTEVRHGRILRRGRIDRSRRPHLRQRRAEPDGEDPAGAAPALAHLQRERGPRDRAADGSRRRRFQLLAEDGHTLEGARSVRTLMIAPSSRRDVLVRGGAAGQLRAEGDPVRAVPGRREGLQRRAGPQPDGADPALGRTRGARGCPRGCSHIRSTCAAGRSNANGRSSSAK